MLIIEAHAQTIAFGGPGTDFLPSLYFISSKYQYRLKNKKHVMIKYEKKERRLRPLSTAVTRVSRGAISAGFCRGGFAA